MDLAFILSGKNIFTIVYSLYNPCNSSDYYNLLGLQILGSLPTVTKSELWEQGSKMLRRVHTHIWGPLH